MLGLRPKTTKRGSFFELLAKKTRFLSEAKGFLIFGTFGPVFGLL